MHGLMRPDDNPRGPLARRSARRRINAAYYVDTYAHDRALELAEYKLGNVDGFAATRIKRGAALAILAAEAIALCPGAEFAVQSTLIDRETAASRLMWGLTK